MSTEPSEVQRKYQIKYQEHAFIHAVNAQLSDSFVQDFLFYKENIDVFSSEASRCEMLISPILKEIYKQCYTRLSFWVQKSLSYDEVLCGTPDYMFSEKSALGKTVLDKPVVIIVEAKKNDFEQGWGQCLAELVTSQKFNEDTKRPVYGVVTDGNLWQFGKLESDCFYKNIENFTIDNLNSLCGALICLIELAT